MKKSFVVYGLSTSSVPFLNVLNIPVVIDDVFSGKKLLAKKIISLQQFTNYIKEQHKGKPYLVIPISYSWTNIFKMKKRLENMGIQYLDFFGKLKQELELRQKVVSGGNK